MWNSSEDLGLGNDKRKAEFKAEYPVNGTPDGPEGKETGEQEASKECWRDPGSEEAKDLDKGSSAK